jgi:hypothetical protein
MLAKDGNNILRAMDVKIAIDPLYETYFTETERIRTDISTGREMFANRHYHEAHAVFSDILSQNPAREIMPPLVFDTLVSGVVANIVVGNNDVARKILHEMSQTHAEFFGVEALKFIDAVKSVLDC